MPEAAPEHDVDRLLRALQDQFGWWLAGWALPGSMRGDGDFGGVQRAIVRQWLFTQYLVARSWQEFIERDDGVLSDSIRRMLSAFPPALREAARFDAGGDPLDAAAWVASWTRALSAAIDRLDEQSRAARARGTEGAVPDPFSFLRRASGVAGEER